MIKTVLFDLDGTLLPFEQEDFVKLYFAELSKKLLPLGYDPKLTVKSIWAGTKAMIENDGRRTNSQAFWSVFNKLTEGLPDAKTTCDEFYTQEFDRVKASLKYIPDRSADIRRIRDAGLRVVLATNPIFPADGVKTRMEWVGLKPEDFELVTNYDNSSFCKPNPEYYREILGKIGEKPESCLMVGNSVDEDMEPALSLGMRVFFVSEFMENPHGKDVSQYVRGGVSDAADYALSLA